MVSNSYTSQCFGDQDCTPGCSCVGGQCTSTTTYNRIYNMPGAWSPTGSSGISGFQGSVGPVGPTGYLGFHTHYQTTRYLDITLNKLYFRNSILNNAINNGVINDLYDNYKDVDLEKFYMIIEYVNKTINNQNSPFLVVNQYNDSFSINDGKFHIDSSLMKLYRNILNFMFGIMKVLNVTEYESYKDMLMSNDSVNINIVLEIMEDRYNKNYYK